MRMMRTLRICSRRSRQQVLIHHRPQVITLSLMSTFPSPKAALLPNVRKPLKLVHIGRQTPPSQTAETRPSLELSMRGSASPWRTPLSPRWPPPSRGSLLMPSTSPAKRWSILKSTLTTLTHISSRIFPSPNPIPSMVAPKKPNFMTRAIFERDPPSTTLSLLALKKVTTQMLESSRFPTNPSLATFGQMGILKYLQRLHQKLLVLHQVLQVSSLKEEEREDEKREREVTQH